MPPNTPQARRPLRELDFTRLYPMPRALAEQGAQDSKRRERAVRRGRAGEQIGQSELVNTRFRPCEVGMDLENVHIADQTNVQSNRRAGRGVAQLTSLSCR